MKNSKNKLEKFRPVIIKKNNRFFVYSRDLNIFGEGKNINEAFKNYQKSLLDVSKVFNKYRLDIDENERLTRKSFFVEFRNFLLKSLIFSVTFILIIILLLPNILGTLTKL